MVIIGNTAINWTNGCTLGFIVKALALRAFMVTRLLRPVSLRYSRCVRCLVSATGVSAVRVPTYLRCNLSSVACSRTSRPTLRLRLPPTFAAMALVPVEKSSREETFGVLCKQFDIDGKIEKLLISEGIQSLEEFRFFFVAESDVATFTAKVNMGDKAQLQAARLRRAWHAVRQMGDKIPRQVTLNEYFIAPFGLANGVRCITQMLWSVSRKDV